MKRRSLLLLAFLALPCFGVGPCTPESIGSLAPPPDGSPTPTRDNATDALDTAAAPGLALPPPAALPPCAQRSDLVACVNTVGCRWLAPGCGDPQRALPRPGCFPLAELDCKSDSACSTGKRCAPQTINPCTSPSSGNTGPAGISSACPICEMSLGVCL